MKEEALQSAAQELMIENCFSRRERHSLCMAEVNPRAAGLYRIIPTMWFTSMNSRNGVEYLDFVKSWSCFRDLAPDSENVKA